MATQSLPACPRVPTPTPWIMQVPVVSTLHFPEADIEVLYSPDLATWAATDGGPTSVIIPLEDFDAEHLPAGLSPESAAVFKHLINLGYSYMRIDPDGEILEDLPVFDW